MQKKMIVYAGSARGHSARPAVVVVISQTRPVTILPHKPLAF